MMADNSMGNLATSYRIDYSADTRVWHNLEPALMDAAADSDCAADAADAMRCHTDTSLKPKQKRYYRVFAVNEFGTSPVSEDPTYIFATTLDFADPSEVRGLTATTHHQDMIDLSWQAPADNGGGTVIWYCINVAGIDGDFTAPTTVQCMNRDMATSQALMDDAATPQATTYATNLNGITGNNNDRATDGGSLVIVVPPDETTFSHEDLKMPDEIALRYRLYVVTDTDGNQDETANTPVTETGRRISLAASNTAIGRTRIDDPNVDTRPSARLGRSATCATWCTGTMMRTHPPKPPCACTGPIRPTSPQPSLRHKRLRVIQISAPGGLPGWIGWMPANGYR